MKRFIKRRGFFSRFANAVSLATARPAAFGIAVIIIVVWGVTGPVFHWSDTWQLVINTGTSVVTFLMVFLIQNTQSRDTQALQVKLDELIRATKGAHTTIIDLEELTDEELMMIKHRYYALAEKEREAMRGGKKDTDTPEVEFESFGRRP